MPEQTRRRYSTECSLCRRNMQHSTSRLSIFTWTRGWHRSLKLCGECTRLFHEWFVERQDQVLT